MRLADFLAAHALLLVGIAILMTWIAAAGVLAAVHAAARHREQLWAWVDLFVPGHLVRARTFLLVHLALGLGSTLAVVGFLVIAQNAVGGRPLEAFDRAFMSALQRQVSPPWHAFFAVLTWLGSGWVVAPVASVIAVLLFRRRHTLIGVTWSVSQAGGFALGATLKLVFERARPDGANPVYYDGGWSFPSGHAMSAFVFAGVGAYLLLFVVRSWLWRSLLIAGAIAWSLLMGFSRLYLGVHYASDVAAGFVIGVAWVAICVSGLEVARRGRARRPGNDASRPNDLQSPGSNQ
jgi:membrane-associated phospholipid phosphatase